MQNAGNCQETQLLKKNTVTEYFRLKNKWTAALQKKPDVVLETIMKERKDFL